MKKRVVLVLLAIVVSVSMLAVGTMAWFTGNADAGEAVFEAGTVVIGTEGAFVIENKSLQNVNPGDCYVIEWSIKNEGTKRIQLRTKLEYKWVNHLNKRNVYFIPAPINDEYEHDWVLYQEAANKPVYAYLRGLPNGLYPDEEVKLRLVVYFDGELTNNKYQDEDFVFGGIVEAVQASNGAPSAMWGNAWNTINEEVYEFNYEFWHDNWNEFDPMNIKCYSYYFNDGEDPQEPGNAEVGEFKITLNTTTTDSSTGIATVNFHIQNLKDKSGNRITGKKDVHYKILINNIEKLDNIINLDFTNGNANNNIVGSIPGRKHNLWKVIAVIDGISVDSGEKKLN